ncbi:MAG TPA: glycosyltransferase [Pyrinomonadaceae bacterium]
MRLQRITNSYPGYLRRFYAQRPGLETEPFAAQHDALMRDGVGWADFWSTALARLGYEASETVSNVEPMQKAWAREHGLEYDEDEWLFEITTAQVRAFRPDVLFVNDYATYDAAYLRQLKSACPSIRLVLGWCGAPYSDASVFHEYDLVLSSAPELVADFLSKGHSAHHVNHAFEPRLLERIDMDAPPDVDFAFVGSISKKNNFHHEREALLSSLIERTGLEIWAEIYRPSLQVRGGVRVRQLAYDAVQMAERAGVPASLLEAAPPFRKVRRWEVRPELPPAIDERIALRARPALFGLEMFQKLRLSRLSLNTHIDISSTHASNMRLYEATGVGSCLVTDWKENLPELFEPDSEVVTYRSVEECVERVEYLLAHEEERAAIARAGQARTLRDHTFDCRAEQLDELIRRALV